MQSRNYHYVSLATATLAYLFAVPAAEAALVVDLVPSTSWVTGDTASPRGTGTFTTGDYDNDNGGTADDGRRMLAFSSTTVITPASPPQSGIFYGGYAAYQLNNTGQFFGENRVRNNAANDFYELGSTGTSSVARIVLSWQKPNFLAGGDTAVVNLTSNTAITAKNIFGTNTTGTGHWMVQIGSTYYVSQETFSVAADANRTSVGLTTTLWAPIDITAALSNYAAPTLTFAPLSLTNIQGVGIYVQGSGANGRIGVRGFSVDATVVPEPAAFAALAPAALVLGRRRR
jgi:hypothetical protein